MNSSSLSWIEHAQRDFSAAELLLENEYLSNIVLFHCQQCVEKCLKAVFEDMKIRIPRIHSTYKLFLDIKLQKPLLDIGVSEDELMRIDEIYTDARYPGSIGLLPAGFPSREDAARTLDTARNVLASIIEFLK